MARTSPARRAASLLLMPLLLAGCVSVRTTRSPQVGADDGGVAVRVFADDDARRSGVPGPPFVVGELERREGNRWRPVFRSLKPEWTVIDLPPGKYRVRFPAVLDEGGNAVRTDDDGRVVRVRKGEVTEVEATLDHFPTGLVVAGVVTAVVAAVLLHDWLDDHDLPTPPLPDPLLADVLFHLTVEVPFSAGCCAGRPDPPPVVTSHFPEEGALVAARRVRVLFALSEPLDPDEVEGDAVTVLAEKTGLVAGGVTYDPANWWVVWQPDEDLPRDDLFHVTLGAEAVEDLGGNELPAPATFTFRTTR
jgi:Bacterial Ig-like domain